MIFLQLFFEFFKTGLFAFGGGLATVPFLYQMSESTGWFTHAQLIDMIAISESTPGPLGVNMATYVGYTIAGVPGGIVATLGVITPSVIVILIIARLLQKFRDSRYVNAAFEGLRPASVALIAAAGITVIKVSLFSFGAYEASGFLGVFLWKPIILAVVMYVLIKKTKFHPVLYLAVSAVVGVVFKFSQQ